MDGSYLPSDLFFFKNDFVDEKIPAPVDSQNLPVFTMFYTSQVVRRISPINSMIRNPSESSGAFHGFRRPWSTTSWSSEKDWERAAQMRWFWWSAKRIQHMNNGHNTHEDSAKNNKMYIHTIFYILNTVCAVLCLMSIVFFWYFLHQLRREKIAWRAMQEEQAEKRKAVAREEAKWMCFSLFWSLIWSLLHQVGCWFAYYSGSQKGASSTKDSSVPAS